MAPSSAKPLDDNEKKVFELITKNDIGGLKSHMLLYKIQPDIVDDHGMTPLTHACFKGNKEVAQYLIDQGADVNSHKHENGYTPLHFAALSGKADLCHLLLAAGAKNHHVNSVGRTAAQMGGFIGNHQCVAVINNYMPKTEIDYYNVPHAPDRPAFLSSTVSSALYKLIMQVNIHPVRVAMGCVPTIYQDLPNVKYVLEMMSQKEMRKGAESNDVLSFKLHYLSFVIGEIMKCSTSNAQTSKTEVFIRKILKAVSGEKYVESLARECIREFPYRECGTFQRLITGLTAFDEPPAALNIIVTVINGQRVFSSDIKTCATCCEETAVKKCSKCKKVQYCDRECQRLHWPTHKKECNRNVEDINNKMETTKIS